MRFTLSRTLAAAAICLAGGLTAAPAAQQAASADAQAVATIIRPARDFTKSYNIEVGVLPYGDDVIHVAPPYRGGGWFDEMFVEYDIAFTAPGDYELWVEYASAERRASGIYWNNKLVVPGTLGSVTGGWETRFQKWEKQGLVSGTKGVHTLRIRRAKEPIPHIRTIKLVLVNG